MKTVKTMKPKLENIEDDFDNACLLAYYVPRLDGKSTLKIFGEEFVKNNKNKCQIYFFDQKEEKVISHELCSVISKDYIHELVDEEGILLICFRANENLTDLSWMFNKCTNLLKVEELGSLKTEKVTSMRGMFFSCISLFELDISKLETSELTDVTCMFAKCNNIQSLNFSGWKTSKITTTKGMFEYCESVNKIEGLDDWDVSNLKDASYMFNYCKSLKYIEDIENWNTCSLTNMAHMFKGLEYIKYF